MSEISQTELLENQGNEVSKEINTHLPAKVVSFDAETQTVSIQIMIDKMDYDDEALPLPPLVDVPVKFIKFGGFTICAEPKEGDEGLAHFSDRCIDGWWESSQNSVPLDIRFHDLSDAFFESGYSSKNNAIKIIPNALHMGADSAFIRLFEDGRVEVKGSTTFKDDVTFEKSVKAKSTIDADGIIESKADVTAQGKSLVTHTHGGVQSGNSVTSPPI